jgi:hypothetical protein
MNLYRNIYILNVTSIYWGSLFLGYCKVCKKETKQIPIRKIGDFIVVEEYCPCCDESIVRYEKIITI